MHSKICQTAKRATGIALASRYQSHLMLAVQSLALLESHSHSHESCWQYCCPHLRHSDKSSGEHARPHVGQECLCWPTEVNISPGVRKPSICPHIAKSTTDCGSQPMTAIEPRYLVIYGLCYGSEVCIGDRRLARRHVLQFLQCVLRVTRHDVRVSVYMFLFVRDPGNDLDRIPV